MHTYSEDQSSYLVFTLFNRVAPLLSDLRQHLTTYSQGDLTLTGKLVGMAYLQSIF